ncbi:TonB-dependent receptor plug domain-containing protein [Maribacter sp. 2304DJ31-5]|uniref:TonB-dependent receptor plug domain-containing protein n=1 Tax=Maribacter sp. 2304DJ31-5 TaxID=3386273 RepID=UPI0039BC6655
MIKKQQPWILPLLLIISHFIVNSQSSPLEKESKDASVPTIEKVYLHTDRTHYTLGEDLWYKAYLVYGYVHVPFDHSNILYVELISQESKVVARNITQLDHGLGHGDFSLSDSAGFKPGRYQLRAYTNWMRNFGDDFIFKKEIEIVDLKDRVVQNLQEEPTDLSLDTTSPKTNKTIDFQFFPEGGSLIEGISTRVAFKAVDVHGNPIEVSGKIFDQEGTLITSFKSQHHGIGTFSLNNIKEQIYTAEILATDSKTFKIPLPKVLKHGYVLNAHQRKGQHFITIKTNQATLDKESGAPLTLMATTRGITYFEGSQTLEKNTLTFVLPTQDFPEGIAQITLYDKNQRPHSERLIYIAKDHDVSVTLSTDKETYLPKEKVNIKVSSKTAHGDALAGSFSLASIENPKNNVMGSNICSYFLMESDIRGKVHAPWEYFDIANPKRMQQLDLLLLTQGWRDFLWKQFPSSETGTDYSAEKRIKVSGRVNGKRKNDKNKYTVTMTLTKEGKVAISETVADAAGNFEFNDIMFTGYASLLLNSQNEEGKNKGKLELNPIYREAPVADFKQHFLPRNVKNNVSSFAENILKKNLIFGVSNENRLDEVVVTGKKEPEKKSTSIGKADFVKILDDKTPSFSTMAQLIQFSIPGVIASRGSIRFSRYNGQALILMDGLEISLDILSGITPDDVDRLEAITSAAAAVYGQRGGNGVIMIYTKEGAVNKAIRTAPYTVSKRVQGFYDARVFYAPDHNAFETLDPTEPDLRNTLHWEPYLHPDENGTVELFYYNSEASYPVQITLEGITHTGIPIVIRKSYDVSK